MMLLSLLKSIREAPTFHVAKGQAGSRQMIATVFASLLVFGMLTILAASISRDAEKSSVVAKLLNHKSERRPD
jgi:hypothetical protein